MTHRLLLGCDQLLLPVAASLTEQPGVVQIGTTDRTLAESLQERGIAVEMLDTIDRETIETFDQPDIVGVFAEQPAQNREIALAARSVFPDAHLVVYTGKPAFGAAPTRDPPLNEIADTLFDPGEALASHVSTRIGESGQRMRHLQRVLRDIDRLGVIAHDNPDPDAIASGIALAHVAEMAGCRAEVCYYGEITHQENRAFINVLNIDLRNLDKDEDLSEFGGFALVDHSRPGVNDQLPPDTDIDIVIDHHPPRSPVDARFVDLRSNVGATSTLLVDYLDRFNIPLDEEIATALLFGIHVDTKGFSREVSQQDFTAGAALVPAVNFGMLERIESPSISPQTFETIASAINNRRVEGSVLLSCVGKLPERDALAQAADRLLGLEGITTTLVYGIKDGTIFVSARSRDPELDLGESLRKAFGQIGSAGGHVDMAGAQIELGVLESVEDHEESLTEIVEAVVASRFLDVLTTQPEPPVEGLYMTKSELNEEYLSADALAIAGEYAENKEDDRQDHQENGSD